MALPVYSIGTHRFVEIVGDPDVLKEQIEIIQRPGVDGTLLRKMGKQGVPFQFLSRVDCQDLADGRDRLQAYAELIGGPAVAMVWSDRNLNIESAMVSVLDVQPRLLKKIGPASGGLNPPSDAWLEAIWTLILIKT